MSGVREERARWFLEYGFADSGDQQVVRAMLAFADAELEQAAKVALDQRVDRDAAVIIADAICGLKGDGN